MNCHECRMQLVHAIERRDWPSLEVIHHFEACQREECQSVWNDYLLLESAIVDWQLSSCRNEDVNLQSVPATTLRHQPSSRVSDDSHQRHRQWRAWSALAACLIALICLPFINRTGRDAPENIQIIASIPDSNRPSNSSALETQDSERSAVAPLLTLEWIGDAPLQVGHSMVSVLLGDEQPPSDPSTPRSQWMEFWPEQLLPIQEEVEAIRDLFQGQQDSQSQNPRELSQTMTFT